jgi:hypothetical protein
MDNETKNVQKSNEVIEDLLCELAAEEQGVITGYSRDAEELPINRYRMG